MYDLDKILREAKDDICAASSKVELSLIKSKFLGVNGILRGLMKSLTSFAKEERPKRGHALNDFKAKLEVLLQSKLEELESLDELSNSRRAIDPTLSLPGGGENFSHPLTQICDRCTEIFSKIGFSVAEGTEIETEWYCFDALNTHESHPSRDDRDTFYFDEGLMLDNVGKHAEERYLLRTHTSTVQIRTMLKNRPPIRVLSPGLVFRKDTMDATHCPNFHQCEGLVVEEGATVSDLKAVLDFFFVELVGSGSEIRIRPSYFPFVSPGFEVDFRSKNLGKLSDRWIEIAGCGMVAPNVFRNCGYEQVTGFAFGMGIERLAMLLYGIDDIRLFYQNNTRFLRQFAR